MGSKPSATLKERPSREEIYEKRELALVIETGWDAHGALTKKEQEACNMATD